jgi:hypothetical protein
MDEWIDITEAQLHLVSLSTELEQAWSHHRERYTKPPDLRTHMRIVVGATFAGMLGCWIG